MPRDTRVGRCYDKNVAEGMDKGKAARVCQSSTGQSLATGRPPKKSSYSKRKRAQKPQHSKRSSAKGDG